MSSAIAQFFVHFAAPDLQSNRTQFRALFEEPLHLAEHAWRASGNTAQIGEVFAFRALLASSSQQEMPEAVTWATQALSYLPEKELAWRSTCMRILGIFAQREGQLNTARHHFHDACRLSETIGNRPIARVTALLLGQVCAEQAELHQAAAYYRHVLHEARAQDDPTDAGPALFHLAQIAYEWNDLNMSQQYAQEAATIAECMADEKLRAQTLFHMACIQRVIGSSTRAQEYLARLLVRLQPLQPLYREALLLQARIQIDMGDHAAAQRSYQRLVGEQDPRLQTQADGEQEELLLARLRLCRKEGQQALELLQRLLPTAQEAGRVRRTLEIRLLMALAYVTLKQMGLARQQVGTVLEQTRSEGYVRLFLDEGKPLEMLLRQMFRSLSEKSVLAFLQTLLQAFAQEGNSQDAQAAPLLSSPLPPLSLQEQRVLRLLAAGCSNPEIARELVVSVNTIRTQVQSIYRKLGVSNRVEASEVARAFHLLP